MLTGIPVPPRSEYSVSPRLIYDLPDRALQVDINRNMSQYPSREEIRIIINKSAEVKKTQDKLKWVNGIIDKIMGAMAFVIILICLGDYTNSTFSEFLTALNVKEEVLELYYEVMTDIFSSDEAKVKGQIDTISKQIAEAKSQLESAQDKLADNIIDSKDYDSMKKRYTTKINDLRAQKEGLINQDSNMTKYMKYAFGLLQNLSQHYEKATFDLKQKMIGSIFPEKLLFDGSTFRTTSEGNLIELLYNGSNGLQVSKNEKAEKKSRLPYQGSPSWARTKDPIINSHVL